MEQHDKRLTARERTISVIASIKAGLRAAIFGTHSGIDFDLLSTRLAADVDSEITAQAGESSEIQDGQHGDVAYQHAIGLVYRRRLAIEEAGFTADQDAIYMAAQSLLTALKIERDEASGDLRIVDAVEFERSLGR